MRVASVLLALPALGAAQPQIPLLDQVKGWWAKATASVSSAIPAIPSAGSVPNPVAAGAAAAAALKVERLTLENHDQLLRPGAATATPGIEEWMIFVTGGNKTCFGVCGYAEKAWNESVVLLSAAGHRAPNLAMLDCETDDVLCNAWGLIPPQVVQMQLPQPLADQSLPATTVRYLALNRTHVTATEIADLKLNDKFAEIQPYEGLFHPFNSPLAKAGLLIPIGYVFWAFSKIPSWAFMILVSFASRSFMSRRMAPQGPAGARGGAPAAAPAAAQ